MGFYKAKLISQTESENNLSANEFGKTSDEIKNTIERQTTEVIEKKRNGN